MTDQKKPKTYNLSPTTIALVTKVAAQLTLDSGNRVSDSEVADNILLHAVADAVKGESREGLTRILKQVTRRRELAR